MKRTDLEQIKKAIVFIGKLERNTDGKRHSVLTGTGSLISVENKIFLVTARHVVSESDNTGKVFSKLKDLLYFGKTKDGKVMARKLDHEGYPWFYHPNDKVDLVVIPFLFEPEVNDFKTIPQEMFIKDDEVYETNEVFYISYQPNISIIETDNDVNPIVRKGMISRINIDGTYYIDGSAFPGNSGSPVYMLPSAIRYTDSGISIGPDKLGGKLVGVIGSYIPYQDVAISAQTKIARIIFEENTGLSLIWSTRHIREILESKAFSIFLKSLSAEEKNHLQRFIKCYARIIFMKTFLLIDGNAMLHRAFHAMPDLTKNGRMVNAVYGFFSMLINVLSEQKPSHIAVCFDRSKPTIRQSMYAGYHAHRPPMADGLSGQIATVDLLLEKMKLPIFALDGYEGDDLIGTIATKVVADTKDVSVIILTGDRDMLQLVNPRVNVLMPIVGLTKTALFTEEKVEEKYGIHPGQFIDYKALIGDQSDGYPGVTGIGPKTAANLLREYKTFEELYMRIGELPENLGTKLALDAEQAALAKKLATIITDAPLQFAITSCDVKKFDLHALHTEFQVLGFNSLITRLEAKFPEVKERKTPMKRDDGQMELL